MRRPLCGIFAGVALVTGIVLGQPARVSAQVSADNLVQFWSQNYPLKKMWADTLKMFNYKVVAGAQPDECFYGLNDPNNDFYAHYPANLTRSQIKACLDSSARLKTNQSYVWGLTSAAGNLWFGTAANNLCLLPSSMFGNALPAYETSAWACEGGGKDARPPRMYAYNPVKGALTDLTPQILAAGGDDASRLMNTIGIRSAGAKGNVVFFGGITTDIIQSTVNMFAFNAENKTFIGSFAFDGKDGRPLYSNVRQWIVASGELYVGVGTTQSLSLTTSGEVLRWIGSVAAPFQFETVGELNADPAYLVEYKGRLVSSTWGDPQGPGFVLYMSPLFTGGTLTSGDKDKWAIVWRMSEYEVEPAAI